MTFDPVTQGISYNASYRKDFFPTQLTMASSLVHSDPVGKIENAPLLEDAVAQLNQDFVLVGIEFDIHDDSGRIVTRVIDRESGEVIRQIPTEEVLVIARRAAHQQGRLLETVA